MSDESVWPRLSFVKVVIEPLREWQNPSFLSSLLIDFNEMFVNRLSKLQSVFMYLGGEVKPGWAFALSECEGDGLRVQGQTVFLALVLMEANSAQKLLVDRESSLQFSMKLVGLFHLNHLRVSLKSCMAGVMACKTSVFGNGVLVALDIIKIVHVAQRLLYPQFCCLD